MIKSKSRGYTIIYINKQWIYEDTKQPIDTNRACSHCGRQPTIEGYDACIGHVPGVESACCGHGDIILIRRYL